jgi:hypothetical protein
VLSGPNFIILMRLSDLHGVPPAPKPVVRPGTGLLTFTAFRDLYAHIGLARSSLKGNAHRFLVLFQLHADTLGAIQQSPKMKAGQRIVGMQPHQRRKGRHRGRVARLEFREGVAIFCQSRCLEHFLK